MKEHLELRISKIIRETTEAITLMLEPVVGEEISYKPGQFLTLLVLIDGKELRRSYSLSSTPDIDKHLAITIKRVANGEVSRYLIDHLKEGHILKALPPAGRFTLQTQASELRDIFLIGAGSGLTPLFSILKDILHHEPQSHCTLIQNDKNQSTGLFTREIRQLAVQYSGRFTYHPLYSQPAIQQGGAYPSRLNIGLLQTLLHRYIRFDRSQAQFYICGPSDYMRMVRMTLTFMEFSPEQLHQEIFVTEDIQESAIPVFEDTSPKKVELLYRQQKYVLESPYNQSILKTGLAHGIKLPYSCLGGVCSTCMARCIGGEVYMAINKVLTDRDIAAGWVLTCVGYPISGTVVVAFE
jgi:ring-1,2-phenylacetyl-CoA epoxidase subunit PaaE